MCVKFCVLYQMSNAMLSRVKASGNSQVVTFLAALNPLSSLPNPDCDDDFDDDDDDDDDNADDDGDDDVI